MGGLLFGYFFPPCSAFFYPGFWTDRDKIVHAPGGAETRITLAFMFIRHVGMHTWCMSLDALGPRQTLPLARTCPGPKKWPWKVWGSKRMNRFTTWIAGRGVEQEQWKYWYVYINIISAISICHQACPIIRNAGINYHYRYFSKSLNIGSVIFNVYSIDSTVIS